MSWGKVPTCSHVHHRFAQEALQTTEDKLIAITFNLVHVTLSRLRTIGWHLRNHLRSVQLRNQNTDVMTALMCKRCAAIKNVQGDVWVGKQNCAEYHLIISL